MDKEAKVPIFREVALNVDGMDCASCVAHVQRAALSLDGVRGCEVNLARGRALVRFDSALVAPGQVAAAITAAGYPAEAQPDGPSPAAREEERYAHQRREADAWLRRAAIGLLLWFPVEATHWLRMGLGSHAARHGAGPDWMTWAALAAGTLSLLLVGGGFYRSAWRALRRFTSNMDTLIAMGASVAYGYSLTALAGYLAGWWRHLPDLYFMEAAGLLALISLGHWLEARARQSAGRAIRELLQLAPDTALRLPPEGEGDGAGESVPVSALKIGDRVLVRPGDRVPIDGTIVAGPSSVDESLITGESLPVVRRPGDTAIGGTQNLDGRLIVRVTCVGAETALAQIVKLVERAQASKPAIQRLTDRIAAVFVPSVLLLALLTGLGWYFLGSADPAARWGQIAVAVCSVLIIACPCALGLAVPAALMVGTGRGARLGILIRDIDALQQAERIGAIVLDKTGTLTEGRPAVQEVSPAAGLNEDELLRLAAGAERSSEHPLARAIVAAAGARGLTLPAATAFRNVAGYGVEATVEGRPLLVGSADLLTERGAAAPDGPELAGRTWIHLAAAAADGGWQHAGTIAVADAVKPDAAAAVSALRRLGLRIVLLTGDNRATAEAIARQVRIDDVRAGVRPDGKAAAIRELQESGLLVAMAGDGINDAPALAQADLGIAMGGGSDIAKETGGIVLASGNLHGIATAIRLSRATMRKIRQNLFFAFIYNVVAIPLAALGLLNPYMAAAAMALSDVTVIGNALLLRRARIES